MPNPSTRAKDKKPVLLYGKDFALTLSRWLPVEDQARFIASLHNGHTALIDGRTCVYVEGTEGCVSLTCSDIDALMRASLKS